MEPDMVCDSCSETPVVRVVRVPPMAMELGEDLHAFDGGWALCATCERLWLARDRDAMVDRAFVKLREAGARPDAELLALMRDVQVPLWLARDELGDTDA